MKIRNCNTPTCKDSAGNCSTPGTNGLPVILKTYLKFLGDPSVLRYPDKHRLAMFRTIIDAIRKHNRKIKIALCKEDIKIWKALGMPLNGLYCNCMDS